MSAGKIGDRIVADAENEQERKASLTVRKALCTELGVTLQALEIVRSDCPAVR